MDTFEYRRRYFGSHDMPEYNIEKYLNHEGKDGWELVSLIERPFIDNPIGIANYVFIFKRKIKQKANEV